MNIKPILFLSFILLSIWTTLSGQEIKLPLATKSGHLYSEWQLNDSIKAIVSLESGFPKIVISRSFAQNNLSELKTEKASKDANIALWGGQNKIKVSYLIKDTVTVNGKQKFFDALVADFSTVKSWKDYDIIYPIQDLSGATEINIKDNYMIVDKDLKNLSFGFIKLKAKTDKITKGLYINTTLQIFDTSHNKEKLKGNFLLDLGAPNAIFIDRNLTEVEKFVINSDRFILKDTTKFKTDPKIELAIIMPEIIQVGDIFLENNFIVAMKMFKSEISSKLVGMIGNKFFNNFDMIFDFKDNEIYMKPNSDNVKIE